MEFKGTKGEWKSDLMNVYVESKNPLGLKFITSTVEHQPVKEFGFTSEETEANAKLIAAAPKLLEALQMFVKQFSTEIEPGNGFLVPEVIKDMLEDMIPPEILPTLNKAKEAIKQATS